MNDRNQHYLHRPILATKVLNNILWFFFTAGEVQYFTPFFQL